MTKQNQSHRLKINNHFDDIINEINMKTETLLEEEAKFNKKSKLESGADDIRNKLNEIRDEQTENITVVLSFSFPLR